MYIYFQDAMELIVKGTEYGTYFSPQQALKQDLGVGIA